MHFLTRYELLGSRGRGASRRFEVLHGERVRRDSSFDLSVLLFRDGPLTLPELATRLGESEATIQSHLDRLDGEGRLKRRDGEGGPRYALDDYHIPIGTPLGFEAALWDHIRVVFRAVSKKVRMRHHRSGLDDLIGGTTFSFDVPEDDPLYSELAGYLKRTRLEMEGWLARVKALEQAPGWEGRPKRRVTIYAGQMVEDLVPSAEPGDDDDGQ
ncbi:MAG: hypothetical protein IV100_19895 [Myxococcales bacterium]|nr:hypothetical protein [Myxococcales bacterium]